MAKEVNTKLASTGQKEDRDKAESWFDKLTKRRGGKLAELVTTKTKAGTKAKAGAKAGAKAATGPLARKKVAIKGKLSYAGTAKKPKNEMARLKEAKSKRMAELKKKKK